LAESACRGARNTVRRVALERLVLQVAALNGCANGCSKGRGDLGIQVRQGREHCWDVVCVVLDGREWELLGCFWWGMELHEIAVEKVWEFQNGKVEQCCI
jgi:hypothetical protein